MADTIKVPGIKEPLPKWAVWGGVGGVGVLIVIYYRKQQNNAAAGSSASTGSTGLASGGLLSGDTSTSYPWDGTYGNPSDPYSQDPSTGQTYGNEGYYGGFGVTGTGSTGGVNGPPFSNNSSWSAYALQQLTQTASFNANNVAEALGLYLDGQVLDKNQQDLVYAAIGVAGPVPVAGPGGFPPKLRTSPGHKGGTQFAQNPVTGLKASVTKGDIEISWNKADHATGYQVSLTNVTAHRTAHAPVTTALTSFTFRGLRPGTYRASVLAKPAEKGGKAAEIQEVVSAGRSTGNPESKVPVPNVLGLTYDNAVRQLSAFGLHAVQEGVGALVIRQQPGAGTLVNQGSQVKLAVRSKPAGK